MSGVRPLILPVTFAVLSLGIFAATASAVQATFFGLDDPKGALPNSTAARNSFLATLSSSGTDTLESFPNNTAFPALVFGATGVVTTSSSGNVVTFAPLAVSGSNALFEFGPGVDGGAPIDDVFTFNQPVTAFGSFFSQSGDDPTTPNFMTLKLENVGLGTSSLVPVGQLGPGAGFDNVFFFGVTDTQPFDRVTIMEAHDFDGILLDDLTVGYLVPEPSAMALVAVGCIAAVLARFGRRRGV